MCCCCKMHGHEGCWHRAWRRHDDACWHMHRCRRRHAWHHGRLLRHESSCCGEHDQGEEPSTHCEMTAEIKALSHRLDCLERRIEQLTREAHEPCCQSEKEGK